MTVYGLVASLAWTASAVLFVERSFQFSQGWLSLHERIHVAKQAPDAPVIPDDLVGLAMGETEKWAQDSVLEAIRERFDKLKDWNKVRTAMGVAQVDV